VCEGSSNIRSFRVHTCIGTYGLLAVSGTSTVAGVCVVMEWMVMDGKDKERDVRTRGGEVSQKTT